MDGLLLVNKPVGITSFDVIRKLRRITGVKKIGHAGTLDPLASGLMLLLFGSATKQAARLTKLDKRYLATVKLGFESTTGDEEGNKVPIGSHRPSAAELADALGGLTGEIQQIPPVYSAIKIGGQEAYKRARRGEAVEIPSRKVTVYEAALLSYEYPLVTIDWSVSSGTYVRTLAQDLGKILQTGAYLTGLVRTEVGEYRLDEAVTLEDSPEEMAQKIFACS